MTFVRQWLASRSTRTRWWLLAIVLLALVAVSAGNGILNGFAYDDVYVIKRNGSVHGLHGWWKLFARSYWPRFWGGDGYRPITMLAFTTEWVIGNGAAWVFHLVNIVLYAITTVEVFWIATMLLPLGAAWLAAALFAVHPVHVEAVANVVGQSELWVAALLLYPIGCYIRRRLAGQQPSRTDVIVLCVTYAVALFAKEHAIVLPAVLVGVELTIARDGLSKRQRLVKVRPLVLWLSLVAALYLAARSAVQGDDLAGFHPFIVFQALDLSYANRVLTMIGVVPEWVRLLLWPARLTTEYAPPYVDIAQGPSLVQLPGFLLLIGILGLGLVLAKRRGVALVASFGIAWLCITLLPTSNFIVPAGIILAERTLFLPSVGALLAIGALISWAFASIGELQSNHDRRNARVALKMALSAILVAGSWRSFRRTPVWHDNDRLFAQAVIDSPQSYRAHYMLGAWYFETNRKKEGERSYRHALALFPYDPFMSYNLAQQYQIAGMCAAAIPLYKWSFEIAPRFREGEGRENLAACLANTDHFAEAREQAFLGMSYGGAKLKELRRIVQYADSALGRAPNSPRGAAKSNGDANKSLGGKVLGKLQIARASGV